MPPAISPRAFAVRVALSVAAFVWVLLGLDLLSPRMPAAWVSRISDTPPDLVLLQQSDGRFVYLGDSVVGHVNKHDARRLPLPQMLQARVNAGVVAANHPANTVDSFAAQLRYIEAAGARPRGVLVALNIRSLGPRWSSLPTFDFTFRNSMYLRPFSTRALAVLEWPFDRSIPRTTTVYIGGKARGTLADRKTPGIRPDDAHLVRQVYRLLYATDLERSPKLTALDDLLETAKSFPAPVLFYVTPIDLVSIRDTLGTANGDLVSANLQKLFAKLDAAGVSWLDLSSSLPPEDFSYRSWPNEHLRLSGRVAVADALAVALGRISAATSER
jgi:hypothetical protein